MRGSLGSPRLARRCRTLACTRPCVHTYAPPQLGLLSTATSPHTARPRRPLAALPPSRLSLPPRPSCPPLLQVGTARFVRLLASRPGALTAGEPIAHPQAAPPGAPGTPHPLPPMLQPPLAAGTSPPGGLGTPGAGAPPGSTLARLSGSGRLSSSGLASMGSFQLGGGSFLAAAGAAAAAAAAGAAAAAAAALPSAGESGTGQT